MGKLSGSALILAGISLGTYTLSSLDEKAATLTAAQSAATKQSVEVPVPEDLRESSGLRPLAQPVPPAAAGMAPPQSPGAPAPGGPSTATASLNPPPAAPRQMRAGGQVLVRIGEAPPWVPVGDPEAVASPPLDRPALARQIQRQLKRIGCYQGPVTGTWSPSVQQRLKVLMDHANASLPIDRPDPVLLAMVESQTPGACSKSCPTGQGRALDGRWLPNALVASPAKPRPFAAPGHADRSKVQAPAEVRHADTTEQLPSMKGRMSLAGPVAVSARQAPARRGRAATYDPRPSLRAANTRSRARFGSAQRPSNGFAGWSWPFFSP